MSRRGAVLRAKCRGLVAMRAGGAEVDAGPGGDLAEGSLETADAVDSGDEGEGAGAAVVGAAGERLDDGVERGGGDGDEGFAVGGDGIGEGAVAGWCVKGVDDGGVHRRSPGDEIGV